MAKFRIRTAPPSGRRTWEPDLAAKVQASLFSTVAMLAAASKDAEQLLMAAVEDAKMGKPVFPVAG